MDTRSIHDSDTLISQLSKRQQKILSLLARGLDEDRIKMTVSIGQYAYDVEIADILDFLHIDSTLTLTRRKHVAVSMYRERALRAEEQRAILAKEDNASEARPVNLPVRHISARAEKPNVKEQRASERALPLPSMLQAPIGSPDLNNKKFKKSFSDTVSVVAQLRGIHIRTLMEKIGFSSAFFYQLRHGSVMLNEERLGAFARELAVPPEFFVSAVQLTREQIAEALGIDPNEHHPVVVHTRRKSNYAEEPDELTARMRADPTFARRISKFFDMWRKFTASERELLTSRLLKLNSAEKHE